MGTESGMDVMEQIATVEEAGAMLGLSYHGAIKLINRGVLPAKRMGKTWIVLKTDVERVRAARALLRGKAS